MGILLSIFGWFTSNIKIISIVTGGLILIGTIWNAVNYIEEKASLEAAFQVQQLTIQEQSVKIQQLEDINEIINQVISQRDKELQQLEIKFEGILDNIGGDFDDQAPESLQIFFERLSKGK